jgi:hypothetical protein
VQILVYEERRAALGAAEDVDGVVEQGAFERPPAELEPVWDFLGPPLGLVGQQPERAWRLELPRQPGKQLGI